mgnify:CR=1 FL=1
MKTSELTGAALDWAVAMSLKQSGEDYTLAVDTDIDGTKRVNYGGMYPEWSSNWAEGGEIIEREGITVSCTDGVWVAYRTETLFDDDKEHEHQRGETPLIAAMRCYVASKLGDEVDVPEQVNRC